MSCVIVIPARLASTRLPEKMLLSQTGMPLIQHTYLRAKQSQLAERVLIATDDPRIEAIAKGFGAEVVMTSPDHATGTDRLAEVARKALSDVNVIINVQGDEPECDPQEIDKLIRLFSASTAAMATLVCRFPENRNEGPGSPADPNCVKAVLGQICRDPHSKAVLGHEVLYFSRHPIPFSRESQGQITQSSDYFMHCGVYAYSPEFLQTFAQLPQGVLEKREQLEQLRVLEQGYKIVAAISARATPGIDTRHDYDAFVQRWQHAKAATEKAIG